MFEPAKAQSRDHSKKDLSVISSGHYLSVRRGDGQRAPLVPGIVAEASLKVNKVPREVPLRSL